MSRSIDYNVSGKTLAEFHQSDAFIRIIRGPVRSGSSVACANELFRLCCEQKLHEGKRRSRYAVVRNTYRELSDTTLKTWKDWFPEDIFGQFNKNEMTHYIKFEDVEAEIMFRALDVPDDIKKLLSLELTGAWLNEMREIPKAILDTITERVGQYPSKRDGGCTRVAIIGDTNSPDTDNYIYELAEEIRPEGWEFFHQPGALLEVDGKFVSNPLAENVHNLNEGKDYYLRRVPGKKKDHIRVYYCNQYGFVKDGKPVHEEYVDSTHCAKMVLEPTKNLNLSLGTDFGLTPAMVLGQRQVNGQWLILDEFVTERMGISRFVDQVLPILRSKYSKFTFNTNWGDPAGTQQAQTDEQNVYDILNTKGLVSERAYHNNDPVLRREAVFQPLTRLIDGKPGLIISPNCKMLRKALSGGFCYKRVQVTGDERYMDKPDKNKYSHVAEALEYMLLGEGEGDAILNINKQPEMSEPDLIRTRLHTEIQSQNSWML